MDELTHTEYPAYQRPILPLYAPEYAEESDQHVRYTSQRGEFSILILANIYGIYGAVSKSHRAKDSWNSVIGLQRTIPSKATFVTRMPQSRLLGGTTW